MSAALLFTFAFALALAAGLVVKLWLATRQVRHVARHRNAVPAAFAQAITGSRNASASTR
jgi:STE24 endopeptidase